MMVRLVVVVLAGMAPLRVNAQTLPACTPDQQARWERASESLGVLADDQSRTLSNLPAKRFDVLRNWYPLDGAKHTICGVLKKWSLYNGFPATPSELDTHPYIVPGRPFEWVVQDLPSRSEASLEACDGAPCIWGEVTAADAFTKWLFSLQTLGNLRPLASCDCNTTPACCSSSYVGDVACGFGPFVAERGHGWRPELHPVERIWAVTERNGRQVLDLLVLQDSSRRFDRPDDFASGVPVRSWRPWAPSPLQARIALAYAMDGTTDVEFNLSQRFASGTPGPFDSRQHTFTVGARQVVVHAPDWMTPANEICTVGGRAQGLIWITAPLTRKTGGLREDGGALAVEIMRSGVPEFSTDPLKVPARFSDRRRAVPEEGERADTEPRLRLDVVAVEGGGRSQTVATLPGVRKYWGVKQADRAVLSWDATETQVLWAVARYEGEGDVAEAKAEELNRQLQAGTAGPIQVEWQFAPVVLDNGDTATIGRFAGMFEYAVELYGASMIKTTRHPQLDPTRPIRGRTPLVGPRARMLTRIFFQAPSRVHQTLTPLAVNLTISARLRDSAGRTGTFTYELPTHTPDVAGAGVEPNVLPEPLIRALGRWIVLQRGIQVPEPMVLQELARDSRLDFDAASMMPAGNVRARVVRLFGLAAVEDRDLSADEFRELLRLALAYSNVRWP